MPLKMVPLRIAVEATQARALAARLVELPEVQSVELDGDMLRVSSSSAMKFYEAFAQLACLAFKLEQSARQRAELFEGEGRRRDRALGHVGRGGRSRRDQAADADARGQQQRRRESAAQPHRANGQVSHMQCTGRRAGGNHHERHVAP